MTPRIKVFLLISVVLVSSCSATRHYPDNAVPQAGVQSRADLHRRPPKAIMQVQLKAPPNEVFDYISSEQTLPEWMPGLVSLSYDHSNSVSTNALGEGSRREMMFGEQVEIEEIVQFERPNLIAYQILEGVPVRNHLAVMTLEARGDGESTLTWYQYFDIQMASASGWLMPILIRRFLNQAEENLIEAFGGSPIR